MSLFDFGVEPVNMHYYHDDTEHKIDGKMAVVRSDNGAFMGNHSKKYKLVPHIDLYRKHTEKLLDADIGSNTAGWQWISGCGADASPYFRIFNPVLQGKKFDPEGHYVRKFIPSLNKIPKEHIHSPWEMSIEDQKKYNFILGKDYPSPIVNLKETSKYAKEKIWGHLKNKMVKDEKKRILNKHAPKE